MIFFDLSSSLPTKEKKYHGGYIYAINLLERLYLLPVEVRVLVPYGYNDINLNKFSIENVGSIKDYKSLENKYSLGVYINVLPNKFSSKLNFSSWRTIYVIHGFRELECPTDRYEGLEWKSFLKAILKKTFRAQYRLKMLKYYESFYNIRSREHIVLYASQFTKNYADLLGFHSRYKLVKTDILYPQFVNENINSNPINSLTASIQGRYMLYLSANRWIKNPVRTLEAIENALSGNPDWRAVIVAPSDHLRRKYSRNQQFVFVGPCSQIELDSLIQGAQFGIYTSLNEGFGLVPYEFASKGIPCIVSDASALPSVYGSFVRYVDPLKISSMTHAINDFMKEPKILMNFSMNCQMLVDDIRLKSDYYFHNLSKKYLSFDEKNITYNNNQ